MKMAESMIAEESSPGGVILNGSSGSFYPNTNVASTNNHGQATSSSMVEGTIPAIKIKTPLDKLLSDLRLKHASTAGTMMAMMELDMFGGEDGAGDGYLNTDGFSDMIEDHVGNNTNRSNSTRILRSNSTLSSATSPYKSSLSEKNSQTSQPSPSSRGQSKSIAHQSKQEEVNTLPYFNLSNQTSSLHRYTIGTAPHAENLLRFTPHLQYINSQSTDMGGPSSSRNLFTTIQQTLGDKSLGLSSILSSFTNNDMPSSEYHFSKSSTSSNAFDKQLHVQYRQVSHELSSFVSLLSNEMSLEEFASVENQVFSTIFSLVHSTDPSQKLAGIYALDAMISVHASADEEKKAIKFANNLSSALRKQQSGDYAFLSAVTKALGRMARGSANVDYVEFEVTRALEWLKMDRPDRRLAACLTLKELAQNAPTSFYSKTTYSAVSRVSGGSNEFIDFVFPVLRDPQPIVRACAADALSVCIQVLFAKQHRSTTGILCQIYKEMMEGFDIQYHTQLKQQQQHPQHQQQSANEKYSKQKKSDGVGISSKNQFGSSSSMKDNSSHAPSPTFHSSEESDYAQHGSLLVMREMIDHTLDFMLPRFDEACHAVFKLCDHPKPLIRLEIIRLIPHLARRCPGVFGRRFLNKSLHFLLFNAKTAPGPRVTVDVRPSVFLAIGQLNLAMKDETSAGMLPIFLNYSNPPSSQSVNPNAPTESKDSFKRTQLNKASKSSYSFSLANGNGAHKNAHSSSAKADPSNLPSLSKQILQSAQGIHTHLDDIFDLVQIGLRSSRQHHVKSSSSGHDHHSSSNQTSSSYNTHEMDCTAEALHCGSDLVEALGESAEKYVFELVNGMFESGLSEDLIRSLSCIVARLSSVQPYIETRLLQEISLCLAGSPFAYAMSDPFPVQDISKPFQHKHETKSIPTRPNHKVDHTTPHSQPLRNNDAYNVKRRNSGSNYHTIKSMPTSFPFDPFDNSLSQSTQSTIIRIQKSCSPQVVPKIILSLKTLGAIGCGEKNKNSANLLPFVHDVVAQYLSHPAVGVRMEAALACCKLLIDQAKTIPEPSLDSTHSTAVLRNQYSSTPTTSSSLFSHNQYLGSVSGKLIEDGIDTLLRVPVSDPSSIVRLCVVRGFDSRYDIYLCQTHHLPPLFLLLQDEALAVRAAALQLLGRLARYNPAPILPPLRKFLMEIISELRCGSDTVGGRECATRLLVVFLRAEALQRLVHPFLPAIIETLPLRGLAPRLASAALEALGELAQVSRSAMNPWVRQIIPLILATMKDQSSASKQRISLRTLGQIAGGTGYVIAPYLEYPELLPLAVDVLPGTKRAPWSLRREVIRTLGILGALNPNRYHAVSHKAHKGGGVGVGYFIEMEDEQKEKTVSRRRPSVGRKVSISIDGKKVAGLKLEGMEREKNRPISITTLNMLKDQDINPSKSSVDSSIDRYNPNNDDNEPVHLYMYEQYTMTAQPTSKLLPARRLRPTSEDFYPTVAVQALTLILKDPSLAVHHGMVMQAVMFIFNALGLRCVPFLKRIVPHILETIQTCGQSSLREALLQQVASLSGIVRDHLRPYVPFIFDVVEEFWNSRHLATVLLLIEKMSAQREDFRKYVPRLVRLLLASLEAPRVSGWGSGASAQDDISSSEADRLELVLRSLHALKGIVREYFHLLVPAVVKLADSLMNANCTSSSICDGSGLSQEKLLKLTVFTIQTLSILLKCTTDKQIAKDVPVQGCFLPSQAAQPLMRMIGRDFDCDKTIGFAIVEALCVCAKQLEFDRWIRLYHIFARDSIAAWQERVEFNQDQDRFTNSGVLNVKDTLTNESSVRGLRLYDETIKEMIIAQHQSRSGLRMLPSNSYYQQGKDAVPSVGSRLGFNSGDIQQSDITLGQSPNGLLNNSIGSAGGFESLGSAQQSNHQILSTNQTNKHKVNPTNLQRAWDVSQRSNREDWDEWMRRLSVELLREAPNPALRATAGLAHAYQPLSRELFSAAFCCCWADLNEQYRANLVRSLEIAFCAESISPEILQTLLNLFEFIEHDFIDGGLPIDISVLADLALKCRAYAKALHYKEKEYRMGGGSSCVEDLISINKKLDLPEAALGVLKTAQLKLEFNGVPPKNNLYYSYVGSGMHSSEDNNHERREWTDVKVKESWLSKLGSWSEALAMYSRKLEECPNDVDAILGCMRCLDARGEWRRVIDLAKKSWKVLNGENDMLNEYTDSKKKIDKSSSKKIVNSRHKRALRFCANAAWRLGQWDDLETYSSELIRGYDSTIKTGIGFGNLSVGIASSHGRLTLVDFEGAFYRSVLHIHRKEWSHAANSIDAARKAMDSRFTALMAESYKRAYPSMVTAQTLAEMEEIIAFRKLEERSQSAPNQHAANSVDVIDARRRLLAIWRRRLAECRVDAEVHSSILAVRSLILGPADEVDATLTLSALSRQAKHFRMAENVLLDPLSELNANVNGPVFGFDIPSNLGLGLTIRGGNDDHFNHSTHGAGIDRIVTGDISSFSPKYGDNHAKYSQYIMKEAGGLERMNIQHKLYYAYIKHLWAMDRRDEAIGRISRLSDIVDLTAHCERNQNSDLRVACWLKLGNWTIELSNSPGSSLPETLQTEVLTAFKRATAAKPNEYKAWHAWALINFRLANQLNDKINATKADMGLSSRQRHSKISTKSLGHHVVAAVQGFVRAISLGTKRWSASVQQDMLNLLTCLFKFGELPEVAKTINDGLGSINIEAWLGVLPQLLARIHIKSPSVKSVLHPLLVRLGAKHPQALMYPLSVLIKSPVVDRKEAAESLMNSLKAQSYALVEEALLVSSELIRVAILWLELWHEGLEDASRLYFGEGNVSGMLDVLFPLHEQFEKGPTTRREQDFKKSFGADLSQAHKYVKEYVRITTSNGGVIPTQGGFFPGNAQNGNGRNLAFRTRQNAEAEAALNQAWDLYYTVFRRINKQLPGLTTLELSECSPSLLRANNLELGVPGTYRVDGSYVKIESFIPNVQVITSKQRPRKIVLKGSDGKEYLFLLKGHEDLRQDERVMQLFGLVNALLAKDRRTNNYDLNIQRYAIAPLSHNAGVVGWVPHTDTLHSLIRDYRDPKNIPLNTENREMMKMTPDYDLLTVMQKVEVFEAALQRSTGKGNDLYEVLWIKSSNSEEWLERRTKYTRSLAVMSMVGYILGLGDRHPSNLMLDQTTGHVVHIDFGDCFEVAMNRDKYPEKVPFRLTRMLINAMEVSGIEGSYRSTCERTMGVLRENRDSLVAMLEAFVYDPLISWRLLGEASNDNGTNSEVSNVVSETNGERPMTQSYPHRNDRISRIGNMPSRTDIDIIDRGGMSVHEPIREGQDEDGDDEDGAVTDRHGESMSKNVSQNETNKHRAQDPRAMLTNEAVDTNAAIQASYNKSLRMYSEIQSMAANLSSSSRIASITGGQTENGSLARSRLDSVRQRGLLSFLEGDDSSANEEALNEKALKVVRRVQEKLTGTDFAETDGITEPLDVQDQVQRLIVQATSSENLCQLFIGWCAFW